VVSSEDLNGIQLTGDKATVDWSQQVFASITSDALDVFESGSLIR
jgi:hypothetical protein